MSAANLIELEALIAGLSHSSEAIDAVKAFSTSLKTSDLRVHVFGQQEGALVRSPIFLSDAVTLGFTEEQDEFTLLQGDIVRTESAFELGERITGNPKYVAINSSCDLVPNRRKFASLLKVNEVRKGDNDATNKINQMLKFTPSARMYLPVLKGDDDNTLCNYIDFDGICSIRTDDLMLAHRVASLSLVGWRIFASFTRNVITRTGPREIEMRNKVEEQDRPLQN